MTGRHNEDVNNIRSNTQNPAENGFVSMANTDFIARRNSDNDGNHQIRYAEDNCVLRIIGTDEYSSGATGAHWTGNSITYLGRSSFNPVSLTDHAPPALAFDENE